MNKNILIVILIAVAGFAISFFLIPSEREREAIEQRKTSSITETKEDFLQKYQSGDRSLGTIKGLAEALDKENDLDGAIKYYEEFIEQNQTNLEARFGVSALYEKAKLVDKQIENLEKIAEIDPSETNLNSLSDVYNFHGKHDKQIEVLSKIIEKFPEDRANYLKLSYLLSDAQNYSGAIELIRGLFNQDRNSVSYEEIELLSRLSLITGKTEDATFYAIEWLNINKNAEKAAALAEMFFNTGNKDQALTIIEPYKAEIESNPNLFRAYAKILIDSNESRNIYLKLVDMFNQNQIQPELYDVFVEYLIKYKDVENLEKAVANGFTKDMTLERLRRLILLAYFSNDEKLVKILLSGENKEELVKDNIINVMNLSFEKDKSLLDFLDSLSNSKSLGSEENLILAKISLKNNLNKNAETFLNNISLENSSDYVITDVSRIYIDLKKSKEGLSLYTKLKENSEKRSFDIGILNFNIALNNSKVALEKIGGGVTNNLTAQAIRDLYFLSNEFKRKEVTLALARKLYTAYPGDPSLAYLALAEAENKNIDEALKNLELIGDKNSEAYSLAKINVLRRAAKTDKTYRSSLEEYALSQLENPNISEENRKAVFFALAENNMQKVSLPYLEKLRDSGDKDYESLYRNATRKGSRNFATSSGSTPRNIDINYEIERLYRLAKDAPPDDKNVKNLVYLIGQKPQKQYYNWLYERALNSEELDFPKWLSYLNQLGASTEILKIVSERPGTSDSKVVRDIYVYNLLNTYRGKNLIDYIRNEYPSERNVNVLKTYAEIANVEDRDLAIDIYEQIVSESDDVFAAEQLGKYYFAERAYSKARKLFEKMHKAGNKTIASTFYLAEIHRYKKQYEKSEELYLEAFNISERLQNPTTEELVIKANILNRFDRFEEANNLFKKLVQNNPRNIHLLADYKSFLYQNRDYASALTTDAEITKLVNSNLDKSNQYAVERLEIVNGLVMVETGQFDMAENHLNQLAKKYPGNSEVRLVQGNYNLRKEKILSADRNYRDGNHISPLDEVILDRINFMNVESKPSLMFDYTYRSIGKNRENISALTGTYNIGLNNQIKAIVERNDISVKNLTTKTGVAGNFSDEKYRGEISYTRIFNNEDSVDVSLYGGENGLGAGAKYNNINGFGKTSFSVEYQRSYWGYLEAVVDDITRDSLRVRHNFLTSSKYYANAEAAFNRYNLEDIDNVTETFSLTGAIGKRFYESRKNRIALIGGYYFDGEYRTSNKTAVNPFGDTYSLFALRSREVHGGTLTFRKEFEYDWALDLYGGYGFDRLSDNRGPSAGFVLFRRWDDGTEVQLRGSRSVSFNQGGSDSNTLGGYIKKRF